MAGFSDASRWVKTNFFLNVLGLVLVVTYTFTIETHSVSDLAAVFAILATIFYILTSCLSFTWSFVAEVKDNKGVHISTLVFGFITAIWCLLAIIFAGLGGIGMVPCLYGALTTFFALLAAIFACVEVAGEVTVTLPKIPSPRKAKKAKAEKDVEAGEEEKKEEAVELEETKKEEEKKDETEGETKEEDKKEEGATNGQAVKDEEPVKEEEPKEEKKKEETEKKEEGEQAAEEAKKD